MTYNSCIDECPNVFLLMYNLQLMLSSHEQVTGLMTQGRGDGAEWVTSFLVSYSLDAYHYLYVTDQYGNQRVCQTLH